MKKLFNSIKNKRIILLCLFFVFFAVLLFNLGVNKLFESAEMMTYDWRAKLAIDSGPLNKKFAKADDNIIILSADNYTFSKIGDFPELKIGRLPWSRSIWGEVIRFVSKGNPKAVVIDMKFEGIEGGSSENKRSDKALADALNQSENDVLAIALSSPRVLLKKQVDIVVEQYNKTNEEADKILYKHTRKNPFKFHKIFNNKTDDSWLKTLDEKSNLKKELLNNITFYKHSAIPEVFLDASNLAGVVNVNSDGGSTFRYSTPLYRIYNGEKYNYLPSLPFATVLATLPENERNIIIKDNKIIVGKREIPINKKGRTLLSWHGSVNTYKTMHMADVLLTNALSKGTITNDKETISRFNKIDPNIFKDKIVVIGLTADETDILSTPMDTAYPGPEFQATAIDNFLNDSDTTNPLRRKFVQRASFGLNLAIVLLFCGLIGYFNIKSKKHYLTIVMFFFSIFLFFILAILLFTHPNIRIWVDMVYPLTFMTITAISTYLIRVILEHKNKKAVEGLFGKFVSPQVLDKLLDDPKGFEITNQRKYMTVLFSDIRGFTTLSENLPADQLVSQLNEYFNGMVDVIMKNEGTMDKFIGDAIMAFWGDPLPVENHPAKAIKAAYEMMEKLRELNKKWESEGKPTLDIGIGINTGEMLVGYMGSNQIVDYTVIGDNVNLASRVEGLCKEYKSNIIIAESTYNEAKDFVEAEYLDEVKVKGKNIEVKIYKVVDLKVDKMIELNKK